MNADLPPISREELEVRLTALLLGELPPAEAAAVRALAANDSELGRLLARLEQAIQLVREGLAAPGGGSAAEQPPAKLSPEKRAQLLARFQSPPPAGAGAPTFLSARGEAPHPGPLPKGEGATGSAAGAGGGATSPGASADKDVRAPAVTPEVMGVKRLPARRSRSRWIVPAFAVCGALVVLAGLTIPALQQAKYKHPAHMTSLPSRGDLAAMADEAPAAADRLSRTYGLPLPGAPMPQVAAGRSEAGVPVQPAAPAAAVREQLRREIVLPGVTDLEKEGVAAAYGGFGGGLGGMAGRPPGRGESESDWPLVENRLPAPPASTVTVADQAAPTATRLGITASSGTGQDGLQAAPPRAGGAQDWYFDGSAPITAGKPAVAGGRAAAPTDPASRGANTHFFADLDASAQQLGRENQGELARSRITGGLADNRSSAAAGEESLLRQAPARPAAGAAPASGPVASGPRLPMPSLKGTPEDLPRGLGIEAPEKTEAEQRERWRAIQESAAAAPATPAPPAEMNPELQARFARRYGLSPRQPAAAAPPPPVQDAAPASPPVLGDSPVVGRSFRVEAPPTTAGLPAGSPEPALAIGDAVELARLYRENRAQPPAGLAAAQERLSEASARETLNFAVQATNALADRSQVELSLGEGLGDVSSSRTAGRAGVATIVNGASRVLTEDARKLYEAGRLAEAAEKLDAALAANPDDQSTRIYRALMDAAQSRDAKAKTAQAEVIAEWAEADKLAAVVQTTRQLELKREANAPIPAPPPQPAAEPPPPPKPPAQAPIPQPEIATAENAFSTFSLNVADVSFKLAQASLEQGVLPDVTTLRSEEFLNAFDYRDPEAAAGQPVAFAWERARNPFAHNRDFLRFSLKTAATGRQAGRPMNLVLLLDNSGSMERADRVRIIQEALPVLASQLQPQDRVSVAAFARTPRLWLDALPGDKAGEALQLLGTLTPQGGTDLGAALQLGYETARRHYLPGGLNRVVLLTDGAANLGDVDPDSLRRKVEAHRQQGIALDCFGIGWDGYNDDLLEVLSRNGDGRYGFVNTPEAAATEFAAKLAGALKVAASDVKVQVEFNPARVTHWRQIGYAKHQLTKEQFRDNTVDAAEIAAQEAGNGLYVIETNPQGQGPLATVRVRYKLPGTSDYRELEWLVPYTGNAVPLAQAGPAMRLAVAATGFAEWLAGSPFAAEITPDRLLALLASVPEAYGADARPKQLEWMIRQAKSLTGK